MSDTLQKLSPVSRGKRDRRASDRSPVAQDVRYKINTKSGRILRVGKTINISSTGVLFSSQDPITPGKPLVIHISWPDPKVRLVARGRVARCDENSVAIDVERFEFRSLGSKPLLPLSAGPIRRPGPPRELGQAKEL